MRICVIIPIHNEEKEIGHLIEEIRKKGLDIIVIDDGSTDQSGNIAGQQGVVVIHHPEKKGKGKSLRDGFDYALKNHYDGVVTMDGDGQHAVSDLAQFIEKANESLAGVIAGSRMSQTEGMPLIRLITNKTMSWVISFLCKQKIPDTQCGFRFIRSDVLRGLTLSCSDFEIETEVLIESSRKGYKIESLPIKTIYRNETSKINPFLDTMRFFAYIVRTITKPNS